MPKNPKPELNPNKRHPWKKLSSVDRIKFTLGDDRKPVEVGKGIYSKGVYLGKISFKDERVSKKTGGPNRTAKRWHRVAIKRFRYPEYVKKLRPYYERAIKDFRVNGINIPKTGFVKLKKGTMVGNERLVDDEWVMVSKFFGSRSKGSKLGDDWSGREYLEDRKVRKDIVKLLTKVANLGYHPHFDIIDPINLHDSVGIIPRDLDVAIEIHNSDERARRLLDSIDYLMMHRYRKDLKPLRGLVDAARIQDIQTKEAKEFTDLYRLAKSKSSPEMENALKRNITGYVESLTASKEVKKQIKKNLKTGSPRKGILSFLKPFIRKDSNIK